MERDKIVEAMRLIPTVRAQAVEDAMDLITGQTSLDQPKGVDAYGEFRESVNSYLSELAKTEKNLKATRDALQAVIDKADEMLLEQMRFFKEDEALGNYYSFQINACKRRVVIDDETKIPPEFKVIKTILTVDKEAIRKRIEAGDLIPGAHLDGGEYLSPKCKNE